MKHSYNRKYIQTYIWQSISLVLNFVSMFIVTPILSSNPVVYGIYILCITTTIFLSYADLGFLGAGYKFASESYARGESGDVLKIAGFVSAILLVFSLLFSVLMMFFSVNPGLIIAELSNAGERQVASQLFLVLGAFSPVIVFQRVLQIIYGVRVEDFYLQGVVIVGNIVKISSVFFFFRQGGYDIVGYFLFSQLIVLIGVLANLILAARRYSFRIRELIKSIRFSKDLFIRMRSLAFSSLLSMVTWILFYELDTFAISRMLGPERLAYYSIGVTIMSIIRNLYGIVYNPFSARFNHYIGLGDEAGLKTMYAMVVELFLPIVLIPLVALMAFLEPFIVTWVGLQYLPSVPIVRVLLLSYLLVFTWYPAGILLTAQRRIREINIISIISASLFWVVVLSLVKGLGLMSFAIAKSTVFLVVGSYYLYVSFRFLGEQKSVLVRCLLRIIPSILAVWLGSKMMLPLIQSIKGKTHLALTLCMILITSSVGVGLYAWLSPLFRQYISRFITKRCTSQ